MTGALAQPISLRAGGSPRLRPDGVRRLQEAARRVRATCVQLAHDGKEGHLNGALSSVEILLALYTGWLRANPDAPKDPDRDRLLFSKGHACTALYAVLAQCGFLDKEALSLYARNDSPVPSHPCIHALPLLDCSAGSLGHGLGMAAGVAYGLRLDGRASRVAAVISDGECNEGSTWEAATFAAANGLDRLLLVVDNNGVQSVGRSDALMGGMSIAGKFEAFGWRAKTVDGHDAGALLAVLGEVPFEAGRPSAIVARTTAGKGVRFMEDQVLWHYRVPSDRDLENALAELDAVPIHLPG
jgi:transketolase